MSGKSTKTLEIQKLLKARKDLAAKQLAIPYHPQDKKPRVAKGQLANPTSIMHSLNTQLKALAEGPAKKKHVDKRKREEAEQLNSGRDKKPHAESTFSQVGNGEFKAPAPRQPRNRTSNPPSPLLSTAPLESNSSGSSSSLTSPTIPSLTDRLSSGTPTHQRKIIHPPIMEDDEEIDEETRQAIAASLRQDSSSSSSSSSNPTEGKPPSTYKMDQSSDSAKDVQFKEKLLLFVNAAESNNFTYLVESIKKSSSLEEQMALISTLARGGGRKHFAALYVASSQGHTESVNTILDSLSLEQAERIVNVVWMQIAHFIEKPDKSDKEYYEYWEENLSAEYNNWQELCVGYITKRKAAESAHKNEKKGSSSKKERDDFSMEDDDEETKQAIAVSLQQAETAPDKDFLALFLKTMLAGNEAAVSNMLREITPDRRNYLVHAAGIAIFSDQLEMAATLLSFSPEDRARELLDKMMPAENIRTPILARSKEKRLFRQLAEAAESGDHPKINGIFKSYSFDLYVLINKPLSKVLKEYPDKSIFQFVKERFEYTGNIIFKEILKTMLTFLSGPDADRTLQMNFASLLLSEKREKKKDKEYEKSAAEALCEELVAFVRSYQQPPLTTSNADSKPTKEENEKREKEEGKASKLPSPPENPLGGKAEKTPPISKAAAFTQALTGKGKPDVKALRDILSTTHLEPADKKEIQNKLALIPNDILLHQIYPFILEKAALFKELTAYLFSDSNGLSSSSSSSSNTTEKNRAGGGSDIVLPPLSNSSASNLDGGPSLDQVASDVDILLGPETPAVLTLPPMVWGNNPPSFSYNNPFGYFGPFSQSQSTGSNAATTTTTATSSSSSSSSSSDNNTDSNNNGPGWWG
jgi:hypothetical protein